MSASLKTSLTIPGDLADKLQAIANDQGRSLASVIRTAVIVYAEGRSLHQHAVSLHSDLVQLHETLKADVAEVRALKAELNAQKSS